MKILKDIFSFIVSVLKLIGRSCKRFWKWYKTLYVGRPWYIKTLSAICSFIVFIFVYSFMVFFNVLWLFGKSPSIESIMHPKTNNASYVLSADGKQLCKYYDENRTPVKFEEINPEFFKALIDTEDERFFSHCGIDPQGLGGALKDLIIHGRARGASTITQQLVKNMFKVRTQYSTGLLGKIPGVGMLIMKTKEWILALLIEMKYDKKDILTMYANTVDFGNNAYGIKTAAKTYYDKTPMTLSIDECATLVGLLKAVSTYNPKRNPQNSMKRRNVVLHNMVTHEDLAQAEYDRLKTVPTELHFTPESADDGNALYFRSALNQEMEEWCADNDVNFYTDGLKIYTTIDSRMQKHAEEAVLEKMYDIQDRFEHRFGMDEPCWIDENGDPIPGFAEKTAASCDYYKMLQSKFPDNKDSVNYYMNKPRQMKVFCYAKDGDKVVPSYKEVTMSAMDSVKRSLHYLHAGLVAMDPRTGFVKAWVGDIDYKTWKYDKVKSMRQSGSTFKLFVYSAAMEHDMSPCSRERDDAIEDLMVFNEEKGIDEKYSPHNANGNFSGRDMTYREAFARSINVVAVRVGRRVGFDEVANTATAMGIQSPLIPETAHEAKPSLCLGSMDVNLLEMTNAYCTVANYGVHKSPVLVTRITKMNEKGEEEEIYNYQDYQDEERVLKARTACLMQSMLKAGTTDAGGTSQSLRNEYVDNYTDNTDFGGKTGTTNNHSDAWFVGVTPNLVTGVWVGGEYRCIHFTSGSQGQGSRTALPICGAFFRKVWGDPALRPLVVAKFVPIKLPASQYDCADLDTATVDTDSIGNDSISNDSINFNEFEEPQPINSAIDQPTPEQDKKQKKEGNNKSEKGKAKAKPDDDPVNAIIE